MASGICFFLLREKEEQQLEAKSARKAIGGQQVMGPKDKDAVKGQPENQMNLSWGCLYKDLEKKILRILLI